MKTLKTAVLSIAILGSTAAIAQSETETTPANNGRWSQAERDFEESRGTVNEYVIPTKKLVNYFVSGEIPADFPKMDYNLTKEENDAIARNWAANNKALLTEEAITKFNL